MSIFEIASNKVKIKKLIKYKKRAMQDAVKELDFERAAIIRDEIIELEGRLTTKK